MIRFSCQQCGKKFAVPSSMAGKSMACSQCGTQLVARAGAAQVHRPATPSPKTSSLVQPKALATRMIKCICQQCGKTFSIQSSMTGKSMACNQCGANFIVQAGVGRVHQPAALSTQPTGQVRHQPSAAQMVHFVQQTPQAEEVLFEIGCHQVTNVKYKSGSGTFPIANIASVSLQRIPPPHFRTLALCSLPLFYGLSFITAGINTPNPKDFIFGLLIWLPIFGFLFWWFRFRKDYYELSWTLNSGERYRVAIQDEPFLRQIEQAIYTAMAMKV